MGGKANIVFSYDSQTENVQVVIVKGKQLSLFGRDWMSEVKLNSKRISDVHKNSNIRNYSFSKLTAKYSNLFSNSTEPIKH